MELADVPDSKSGGSDTVPVRPRSPAPQLKLPLRFKVIPHKDCRALRDIVLSDTESCKELMNNRGGIKLKLHKQNSFELKKIKNGFLNILRFVPLILCVIFMAIYLFSDEEISAENLLNYAPEKPLYAAIFLVLLYALKSLTIVFTLIVLKLLGGFLFDPIDAIIVNSIGVLVELIVPYWVGRLSGAKFVEKICAKYPKINEIFGSNDNNDFFISFFLRTIDFLPGDVISMAFGTRKFPFFTSLVGSFLGMLPGIITATLLGTSITNPTSPMFWISISLTVGLSVSSALIYYIWRKKKILS